MNRRLSIWLRLCLRKAKQLYAYCTENVWKDPRSDWYVTLLKIINLSVKSFFDKNTQMLAGSLTYTTLLAVVPVLSLLLAIAKGFGLQNLLVDELYRMLPSQQAMLDNSFSFVNRFLGTMTKGIFMGIGIIFLLWTMVSLLRKIERVFNHVWQVRAGRPFIRIITDYTAILLIMPVLMICSAGLSYYLSGIFRNLATKDIGILLPIINFCFDLLPILFFCVLFVGMNVLIPYTKVKLKNAILPGLVCGLLFYLIQYAFVHGQISVTKYNAVYGGFAFLPLFLIWLQFSWTICIASAVMTYSSQNFFRFNYASQVENASVRYLDEVAVFIMAIAVRRFEDGNQPFGIDDFVERKNLPIRLVNTVVERLVTGGFLNAVIDEDKDEPLFQPASNFSTITVGEFLKKYHEIGESDFIEDTKLREELTTIAEIINRHSSQTTLLKLDFSHK